MDGIPTSPETSGASPEPVASPATTPASAPGSEAVNQASGAETAQPAIEQPNPATVAGGQDEFPDDASLQALPGPERASNWERLRTQYGELKQRVGQLSQLESFQPIHQSIEEMGGWESVEPRLQIANQLFSQAVDPQTGEPLYDDQGYPQHTSAPFVDSLAAESPQMMGEIMWRAFHTPLDGNGDTYGNWLLRNLGLNLPLATYQQMQSPEDARNFTVKAGGIDPAVLEGISPEYHDAAKSLMATRPGLRQEWEHMSDEARSELLEERKQNLESQSFIQDRKARDQEDDRQRAAAAKERVEQAGANLVQTVQQQAINAQYERLKQTATFFTDPGDNQVVWDNIVAGAAKRLENDPKSGPDSQKAANLYKLSVQYDAQGDRWRAREAKVQADRLVIKLNKSFTDHVNAETGAWSRRLGGARAAQQQQIQEAKPRIEIGTTGGNPTPQSGRHVPTPPRGQSFGHSDEEIDRMAQGMRRIV